MHGACAASGMNSRSIGACVVAVTKSTLPASNSTMSHERTIDLAERTRAAATGDKVAAHAILEAVRDDIYGLALRMLGQPADAEDAAQEIVESAPAHGVGDARGKILVRTSPM